MGGESQSSGIQQQQQQANLVTGDGAGAAARAANAPMAIQQVPGQVPAETTATAACGAAQQPPASSSVGTPVTNSIVVSASPKIPEAPATTTHTGLMTGSPSAVAAFFPAGDVGSLMQEQQQQQMHRALQQQPPLQTGVDVNTRSSGVTASEGGLKSVKATGAQQQAYVIQHHQQQNLILPQQPSLPYQQPSAFLQDAPYQQQHLAQQQQYLTQQQQYHQQQLQHYSTQQQHGEEAEHGSGLAVEQQALGQQLILQEHMGNGQLVSSSSSRSTSTCAGSNTVSAAPSIPCFSVLSQPERIIQPQIAALDKPAATTATATEKNRSGDSRNGGIGFGAPVAVGATLRFSQEGGEEAASTGLEDDAELSAHAAAAVDFAVAAGAVALDGWSGRAVVSSTAANPHLAAAAAALQAAAAAAPTIPPAATAEAANGSPPADAPAHPCAAVRSGMGIVRPVAPASCGGASIARPSAAVGQGGTVGAPAAYSHAAIAEPFPQSAPASSMAAATPTSSFAGAGIVGLEGGGTAPAAVPAAAASGTRKPLAAGEGGGVAAAGGAIPGTTRRRGMSSKNEVWRERLRLLEPFLDVEGILLMKQCCRLFYRHKYRPAEGILRFQQLRGFDPKVLMEQVLPLVCRSVHATVRQRGLLLDFSHCVLIKDGSIARLMDAVHGEPEENQILGKLRGLHLNYCNEITEKGLAAMFTTYLPHLEVLRMRCARSTELTYISSLSHLSSERWPSLIVFDASFTYLWLDAATAIADCLFDNAARLTARRREQETRLRKEKREKRRQLLLMQEMQRIQQQQDEMQLLQQQRELQLQQQREQQAAQQQQGGGGGNDSTHHLEELDLLLGKENGEEGTEKGDGAREDDDHGRKKKEDGSGTQQLLDVEEIPVLRSPVLAPQSYPEQRDNTGAAGGTAKISDDEAVAQQPQLQADETWLRGGSIVSNSNTGVSAAADETIGQCGAITGEAAAGIAAARIAAAGISAAGIAATAGGGEINQPCGLVSNVPPAAAPAAVAPAGVALAVSAAAAPVLGGVWGESNSLELQTEDQEEQEDMRAIAEIFITPTMEILGSVASKNLLRKIGLEALYRSFCYALTSGDVEGVALALRRMQRELSELAAHAPYNGCHLLVLQQFRGAELLANAPLIVETPEEGGVNVATLPISTAIQNGDSNMLNLLLRSGAKIDVCDYLGKSPLYLACEKGRKDFVELLLLQHGASPQAVDIRSPFSPLNMAIKRADVNILKLLLSKGASLDVRCPAVKTYKSALFVACEANSKEAIQLCLQAGADPNRRGQNSNTPTLLAYQLNSAWLPQFVAAGAGRPLQRRWVLTDLLSNAIFRGDVSSVELLIREFPDLLTRDHQLWSKPLIQAAKQGKAEVISALLAAGCPLDVRTDAGQTPLMAAAQEDFVGCVQLLLDRGANINDIDYDGLTALHVASTENRMEVANLLLLRGCDVNIGDKENGETALMMAIRMRNEKMALQILEKGRNIDLEKKNVKGETALLYAMFFGQYPVAGQLMDRGAVSVCDHMGDSAYVMACERILTPGADKRVLRKFMRLHKAAQTRTNSSSSSRGQVFVTAAGAAARGDEQWNAYTAGEESAASGVDSGPDGGALVRQLQQQAATTAGSSSSMSYRKGSSGRVRGMKSIKMCVGNVGGAASNSQPQQQHSSNGGSGHGSVVSGVGGLLLGSGASRTGSGRATERQVAAGAKASDNSTGLGGAAATAAEESLQSGAAAATAGGATPAPPQRRSKGMGGGSGGKKLKLETKTVLQVARLPITLFRAAKAK